MIVPATTAYFNGPACYSDSTKRKFQKVKVLTDSLDYHGRLVRKVRSNQTATKLSIPVLLDGEILLPTK